MASSDSDPKNMHGVENNVKEHKEKKKKKKRVADVPDHIGIQPEVVKGVRTMEKPEDPEDLVEPEPVSSNLEGKGKKKKRKRDREDGEPPPDDKKKKRKKEKTSGDLTSALPATDPPLEVADTSDITGTAGTTSGTKEKKKRKKDKSSAETIPSAGATDDPEKPRKWRPKKDNVVDANVDAEPSSKTKSKSKKRKKRETIEGEDRTSTVAPTDDSPQKRKKSRKSIHPDPSDDSDLTEQSQKALIYIYSHSTSPKTWKFNKARQNWIIRNIWTSKVPEKYVPMVVEYLSKVQGQVRETLIESCKKVISGSNQDPPIGIDEKGPSENPPTQDTIGNEKTERANTLLYALTRRP